MQTYIVTFDGFILVKAETQDDAINYLEALTDIQLLNAIKNSRARPIVPTPELNNEPLYEMAN